VAIAARSVAPAAGGGGDLVERRLLLRGGPVRLVEGGTGPTVVLLHGFADSLNTWRLLMPRLAARHHVIAVDLPGFGESAATTRRPMLQAHVAAVSELVRRRAHGQPVTLVGNSMGGAVALHYAVRHPDAVDRLVLIGCAGLARGVPLWWRVLTTRAPVQQILSPAAGWAPPGLVELIVARVYRTLAFHDASRVDPESVAGFSRFYRSRDDVVRLLALARDLVSELDGRLLDLVGELRMPCLLLWGRHDRFIPVEHALALQLLLRRSRLHVIEDCGHCPQLELPDIVGTVLGEFLARSRSQPGRRAPATAPTRRAG
jgi:pimeloyl-ACP methyl ester carboxylesterase